MRLRHDPASDDLAENPFLGTAEPGQVCRVAAPSVLRQPERCRLGIRLYYIGLLVP